MKHVQIQYALANEAEAEGHVCWDHINTKHMVADMLTNQFNPIKFVEGRRAMGVKIKKLEEMGPKGCLCTFSWRNRTSY